MTTRTRDRTAAARHRDRIAAGPTPRPRLWAAASYLAAVLGRVPAAQASALADAAVTVLVGLAESVDADAQTDGTVFL